VGKISKIWVIIFFFISKGIYYKGVLGVLKPLQYSQKDHELKIALIGSWHQLEKIIHELQLRRLLNHNHE
jgi:hypothetical protein